MTHPPPPTPSPNRIQSAITRALKTVAHRPARVVFYGAAALALASGLPIPPEFMALEPLIKISVGVGVNVLSDMLRRAAYGDDVNAEEMRAAIENAVSLCSTQLDGLLSDDTFQRALARQMHELRIIETLTREGQLEIVEKLREQIAAHNAFAIAMHDEFADVKRMLDALPKNETVLVLSRKIDLLLAIAAVSGGQNVKQDVGTNAGTIIGVQNVNAPQPVQQSLHQLPAPPADFTGRAAELADLRSYIGTGGALIAGLRGMGGVGKTALALVLAHELKPHYPDAQFFMDMRGLDDTPTTARAVMEQVVRGFLGSDTKLPDDEATLTGLYRSVLGGQKVLLLLDNAKDAAQVRELLPPSSCLTLVTSRLRFALPGLYAKNVEQMSAADALAFLLKLAPRLNTQQAAAERIAGLCGSLPLALRAAGSLLEVQADLSVTSYADELSTETKRLERIGTEGVELGVEASLNLSYRRLAVETAALFRALSVFPATFAKDAAAAVGGQGAAERVSELLRYSLVEWDDVTNRYHLHDLARDFARGKQSAAERETARRRHAEHYARVLRSADQLFQKGNEHTGAGLSLFDAERGNIEAGHAWATERAETDDEAARLCDDYPDAGAYVLGLRLHRREHIDWLAAALAAARRREDKGAEGAHLGNLGNAYANLGETRRAIEYHEQYLAIAREFGDQRGEGTALGNLGNAYADLGETRRAVEFYEQQLTIMREIGDRRGEGQALGNLGVAYADLGETRRAIDFFEQHRAIAREIGDRRGEGAALGNLGLTYYQLGETRRAIDFFEQRLAIAREIGDRRGEGNALGNLGIAYANLGETRRAIDFFEQRLAIAREIGDRRGEGNALGNLGLAYDQLGETRRAIDFFEQHLAIAREIGDRRGEGNALGNLGLAYDQLGETRRAIDFFEQQLVIVREIGNRRGENTALWNMALALDKLGERKKAIETAELSLKIHEEIEDPFAETVRNQLAAWKAEGVSGVDS